MAKYSILLNNHQLKKSMEGRRIPFQRKLEDRDEDQEDDHFSQKFEFLHSRMLSAVDMEAALEGVLLRLSRSITNTMTRISF